MPEIYGIGNPLMDIVMNGTHADLDELGVDPGSMNLVDGVFQREVLGRGRAPVRLPGGSAANTMRGIAFLADDARTVTVRYGGAVGRDEIGTAFGQQLSELGIIPLLAQVDELTGTSAILVTPDYERTMFTHLGACRSFSAADVDDTELGRADWVYFTGYMWDTKNQEEAARHAVERAHRTGTKIAFDIADPFVVERYRDQLHDFLPGKIDLLFGNREELRRLTGIDGEASEIARAALEIAPMVALKTGSDGCVLAVEGSIVAVPAFDVETRDTTGAGDAFAGGFLFALLIGESPLAAAKLANRLAAGIVTVPGCHYEQLSVNTILAEGLVRSRR